MPWSPHLRWIPPELLSPWNASRTVIQDHQPWTILTSFSRISSTWFRWQLPQGKPQVRWLSLSPLLDLHRLAWTWNQPLNLTLSCYLQLWPSWASYLLVANQPRQSLLHAQQPLGPPQKMLRFQLTSSCLPSCVLAAVAVLPPLHRIQPSDIRNLLIIDNLPLDT